MTVNSDDFSAATLDPIWSLEGASPNATIQVEGSDAFVALSVPEGDFDIFDNNYGATRLLQDYDEAVSGTDFSVEAKFLSSPNQRFQIQGIVIEQDLDNWIRFDLRFDGSELLLFGGSTISDNTTQRFNVSVQPGDAQFLRVVRTGDQWSMEYSADGVNYQVAGTFTHQMTVTGLGPFAAATNGNAGPGFTAEVDYFFNTAAPILDEDSTLPPVNEAPTANADALATIFATDLIINVGPDLLANDTDPENEVLGLQGFTQPANGTLVDNGDGTLTYTPDATFVGLDSFVYTVTDGANTDTATVTVQVDLPSAPSPIFATDPSTFPATFNGRTNSAVILPHDSAYEVPNGAWIIEFNASELPELRHFLLSKDSSGFDDGGHFAIYMVPGTALNRADLIVRFQDLSSTIEVTVDNAVNDNIDHQLVVNFGAGGIEVWLDGVLVATDPYAGGLVGNAEPLVIGANQWASGDGVADILRDAMIGTVDNVLLFDERLSESEIEAVFLGAPAIVAVDDVVSTEANADLTIDIANDLLGNDVDSNGDVLQLDSFTQPVIGTLTDNGDGTLTYTPDANFVGNDTFTYVTSDEEGNSESATVTVDVSAPPAALTSDDFSGESGILSPIWALQGPAADAIIQTDGTDAFVSLSVPQGDFDIFDDNNATRLLQNVVDEDMSVEARFLSEPSARFQVQGILVEQDAANWIRFDLRFDGSNLRLFAGTTVNNNTNPRLNIIVQPGEAEYLRVTRTGNDWVLEYSGNGTDFTEAGSFTHQINVNSIGPFASATDGAGSGPGFTAEVDYFFDAAAPIDPEDVRSARAERST